MAGPSLSSKGKCCYGGNSFEMSVQRGSQHPHSMVPNMWFHPLHPPCFFFSVVLKYEPGTGPIPVKVILAIPEK